MPVLSSLIDNFDDNTKDTGKWASTTVPAGGLYFGTEDGTTSETSSALRLETTWDGDSSDFAGYSSNDTALEFHGSSGEARVQIKNIDATAGSTFYLSVGETSFPPGHNAEWQVELSPTGCLLRAARNYFGSSGTSVTVDAGVGLGLRGVWLIIRADGTDTVWEIAPNDRGAPGVRREIRRDNSTDFPNIATAAVSLVLSPSFTFGQDSTSRVVIADNFNYSPTAERSAETTVVAENGSETSASLTTSAVTPTGDDRAVLVFTNTNNDSNGNVNEVKYNNDSGTLINTLSGDYVIDLFGFMQSQYSVRGDAGSPNTSTAIYAEFNGTPQFSNSVAAIFLENVDQTTPFGTIQTAGGYISSNGPSNITQSFSGLEPYQKVVAGLGIFQLGTDISFTITPDPNSTLEIRSDGDMGGEPRWVTQVIVTTYANADGTATVGANVLWNNSTADQFAPYRIVAVPVNTSEEGGGAPITGDANITESGDSSTTDVDVLVQGTSTLTEGANTLSATAGVLVSGSATITQGADTVASTAGVVVGGTATITEAGDTVSSGLTHPVVGTSTITESADTLSSGLTHPVTATAAITEAAETLSSGLTHPVTGTATITEAGDTVVATIGSVTNASLNVTESPDTSSSTAGVLVQTTSTITEASDTATTDVDVVVTGNATITEAGDTLTATSGSGVQASLNVTEVGDSLSSGLTHPVTATAAIAEAGDVLSSATGVLVSATSTLTESGDTLNASSSNQPVINASLTVAEGADTVSSTTQNTVGGNASITEVGDSVVSSAVVLVSAAVSQIELPDGLSAQAAVSLVANAAINEAGDTLLASLVFNVNAALVATEAGDTLIASLRTLVEDAITYRERPLTYTDRGLVYQYKRR